MRKLLFFLVLFIASRANAQQVVNGARAFPQANDGSTGTTLNGTATINTSGNAINASTGTAAGTAVYIVVGGAGTTGNAALAMSGLAACTMDSTIASAAGGFYVINSTTTSKDCHAQSAAPANGTYVIGYLTASSTTSGSTSLISVSPFVYSSGSTSGTVFEFNSIIGTGLSSGTSQFAPTANNIYLWPFYVPYNVTGATVIHIEIQTLDAGNNGDIGIYGPYVSAGTCSLVVSTGSISTASTGWNGYTVSSFNLTGGNWYVLATTSAGTTAKLSFNTPTISGFGMPIPFAGATALNGGLGGTTLPASYTCTTATYPTVVAGTTAYVYAGVR